MDYLPELDDRYTPLRLIGSGGMATVFLAQDRRHDRQVAIKVLDPELARLLGPDRFQREIRIVSQLEHPNIVPLYDSGDANGQLYYVMPFLAEGTLRDRLKQEPQQSLTTVLEWTTELAAGLAYAHQHGFVHRDVKPENVLIQAGRVMLSDFGIARAVHAPGDDRITSRAIAVGTPRYMSPEQAAGSGRVDERTDVFSLACVVYEALAGEPPFTGATPQAIAAKKAAGEYPRLRTVRPSVPARVERVLAKALAPVPADRYGTVSEFADELGRAAASRGRALGWWVVGGGLLVALLVWLDPIRPRGEAALSTHRVVVDLFVNRTGDPSKDPIGPMAAIWVTEGLQAAGPFDVVPTTSSLAAAEFVRADGQGDPVERLAAETGAGLVITGSYYRDGGDLVIRAEVADARTDRIAGAIAPVRVKDGSGVGEALRELRARLSGLLAMRLDERLGPREARSAEPPRYEAYQAFSEGMEAYVRTDYRRALARLETAYRLDTSFVLPLLYAAVSHSNSGDFAAADSVLSIVAARRAELSTYHRHWLDYAQAELRSDDRAALESIRAAAALAPGSKAVYNLAVTALEAREPAVAESALRTLAPDRGPMRGWLPYWDVLGEALHALGKHRAELRVGRQARARHGNRASGYVAEARALGALLRTAAVDALLDSAAALASATPRDLGSLAKEAGSELLVHGNSAAGIAVLKRAEAWYAAAVDSTDIDLAWERAQVAALRGDWVEALRASTALAARDPHRVEFRGSAGVALAQLGRRDEAGDMLSRLEGERQPYGFGRPKYEAARIAASLGDSARAAILLRAARAEGLPFSIAEHRDPALRPEPD